MERTKRGRTAALSKSTSSENVGSTAQRAGVHGVHGPCSTKAQCASYRGTCPAERPQGKAEAVENEEWMGMGRWEGEVAAELPSREPSRHAACTG